MKILHYFLFFFFISRIKGLEACLCDVYGGKSVDSCKSCYNLGSYCCLLEYHTKEKEVARCTSLTQNDYDNIDTTIAKRLLAAETIELQSVYGFSIDCQSNYLKVALLIICLFLF